VKFSFAGWKLYYFFHPYYVKFKQWTCLNLIFEQSIVSFRDINTIILMYVNLFFIKRIKASIIKFDSMKTITY